MCIRDSTCIYASAGRTGSGVITEARARTAAGETLWCVGDDTDQLMLGVYYGADSAVLTSATKDIAGAVQDVISLIVDDAFPGGQTLVYDISTDSVGIPLPEEPEDGEEPDLSLIHIFFPFLSAKPTCLKLSLLTTVSDILSFPRLFMPCRNRG